MCHVGSEPRSRRSERPVFRQITAPLGANLSLDNIGDVLEVLDDEPVSQQAPIAVADGEAAQGHSSGSPRT